MTDNKARARITLRIIGEETKLRIRRRKDVPDEVIDAWYIERLGALRTEATPLDPDSIKRECVEACNCTLPLARAGWRRQFPLEKGERHRGGRGKRLR